MGVSPLTSYNLQSSQSSALQALLLQIQTKHSGQTAETSTSSDQLSVSPMAHYFAQVPEEIQAPLQDLMTTRKDVTADLKALQTYYEAHPKERTELVAAIQAQSAAPLQTTLLAPTMQAGIVDLYALSSQIEEAADTKTSAQDLGKALLTMLQQRKGTQGSLLDALDTSEQRFPASSQASLFSYLS